MGSPLRWGYEGVAIPFEPFLDKNYCEDCNKCHDDGYLDLTLKFKAQDILIAIGVEELEDGKCVLSRLTDNFHVPIIGEEINCISK